MLEWKWKFDSKPALALCLCLSTKLGAVINMQQVLKHQTVTHVLTAHWLCQRNPMAAALSCEQAGAVSEPQIWNIGTDSFIVLWLGILVFVTPVIPQIVSLLLSKNLLWILQSCLTGSGCGDREGHSDVVYIIFTLIRPFSDSHVWQWFNTILYWFAVTLPYNRISRHKLYKQQNDPRADTSAHSGGSDLERSLSVCHTCACQEHRDLGKDDSSEHLTLIPHHCRPARLNYQMCTCLSCLPACSCRHCWFTTFSVTWRSFGH